MPRKKAKSKRTRSEKTRHKSPPARSSNSFRQDSTGAKAFAVLARSRRTGESPEAVSRQFGTYFAVVRRHLPGHFRKVRGRWVPTKSDRSPRGKQLLTEDGYERIVVRGSKKAAELNRYNQVVARFIRGKDKDPSALAEFERKRIAGHRYLTDPDKVFRLADAGIIKTDELGSDQVSRGGRR
ncbi:MAG TPA: hypothetical protein VFA85_02375 [Terriglobales bacterium]|nr:hypothetical protein [Terriglobales bacterium]